MDDVMAALASRLQESSDDPLIPMLIQQMMSQQDGGPPFEEQIEDLTNQRDDLASQLQRCKEARRRSALAYNNMAAFVSERTGSCANCWGLNLFCDKCSGSGKPGTSKKFDVNGLLDWIGPALQAAGLTVVPLEPPKSAERATFSRQQHGNASQAVKGASDVSS